MSAMVQTNPNAASNLDVYWNSKEDTPSSSSSSSSSSNRVTTRHENSDRRRRGNATKRKNTFSKSIKSIAKSKPTKPSRSRRLTATVTTNTNTNTSTTITNTPTTTPLAMTMTAKSSPKRSWRSTGWTPLSYPANALYQNHDRTQTQTSIGTTSTTKERNESQNIHDQNTNELNSNPNLSHLDVSVDMNMNHGRDSHYYDHGHINDHDSHRHHGHYPPSSSSSSSTMELNPFFPLHRDVILATARELLILDGALDGSTLEVNVHKKGKGKGKDQQEQGPKHKKEQEQDPTKQTESEYYKGKTKDKNGTLCANAIIVDEKTKNKTGTKKSKGYVTVTIPVTGKTIMTKNKPSSVKLGKRKHASIVTVGTSTPTAVTTVASKTNTTSSRHTNNSRSSIMLAALHNECPSRVIPPSAEALAEILLQHFVVRDHAADDATTTPGAEKNTSSVNVNVPTTTGTDHEGEEDGTVQTHDPNGKRTETDVAMINRVRKVSDADAILHHHRSATTAATGMGYSPHLAVVAINLISNEDENQGQNEDIESCIRYFVKHRIESSGLMMMASSSSSLTNFGARSTFHCSTNSNSGTVSISENEEEAMLLRLQREGSLPKLLDLSIMMEVHLRQVALATTKHSFTKYIGEKALREFLGYKSPAQKKDRVVELISDFMFDVSHAMFAWEQTENDMYGNDIVGSSATEVTTMDDNRDATICKTLFDRRALRKIGGFEPTSLLYHALSIQRQRRRGGAWTSLAKTTIGRKMFAHHRDNHVKVHVGQMRRDKRMKKNLTTATTPSYHSMVVEDGEKAARSRSCSISSDGTGSMSGETKVPFSCVSDSITRIPTVSPVVPNLFPITITRETGRSWGILLAREGSMCVVMRVPDVTKTASSLSEETPSHLQRGDLIVSIRNERNECVNTPTRASSHRDSWDTSISPEWFKKAVGIFKESYTLHLEVRRAISIA